MDPIDLRAETTFSQGLRCLEYRLPSMEGFRPPGYVLALGVRYGMIGVAAAHHLLTTSGEREQDRALEMAESWPGLVVEHVQEAMRHRLPFATNSQVPRLVGSISSMPLRAYIPLYKKLCPLSRALELVGEAIAAENRPMIFEGWSWFKHKSALRIFRQELDKSRHYGLNFFERRQADLEEVPEIALIGE